jgi:hypothetical protein
VRHGSQAAAHGLSFITYRLLLSNNIKIMNYKSISIHLLRRTAALVLLMVAFTQSSWGGARFYYKSVQITIVPSNAGKVYADTKTNGSGTIGENGFDTGNVENIRSQEGSDFRFDYCISAGYDDLYFTSTDIKEDTRFVLSKVYNRESTEYTVEEKPSEDDWNKIKGVSMDSLLSKFYVEISPDLKDSNDKDYVLNGDFYKEGKAEEVFPNDSTRKDYTFHTYPDAYVRLYCGQVITDKYNLPARDESYEYVCYDRTFYKGWNSVCLPFGIKTDDFKAKLGDGCKLATFSKYNAAGNTLQFETVDEVAAGVPCLVYNDSTETKVSLNVSTVERGYAASPVNGEYMKGTFINNSYYGKKILRLADENSFAWTSDDPMVISYRAWIEIPEGSAKALTIDIDGETTAISAVETADAMPVKVYTAGGVQTKSTVKGLNIVKASDGRVKKVMVK